MGIFRQVWNPRSGAFNLVPDISLLKLKGTVATVNDLPLSGNSENDCYVVKSDDSLYTWNSTESSGTIDKWVNVGNASEVDWSNIQNKPELEPKKSEDDNYVTDAEKVVIGNTSGVNTGDQDLSGKVDKVENKSLVLDIEITKIHAPNSDNQTAAEVLTNETGETVQDHIDDIDNPHSVTKTQVGLSNVDNKSEATIITDVKADSDIAKAILNRDNISDTIPIGLQTDVGKYWNDLTVQFDGSFLYSQCYLENGIILGGSQAGNLYRSIDYGLSWAKISQVFGGIGFNSICYLGNGIVLLVGGNKLWRSIDYGLTWTDLGISNIRSVCYLEGGIALAGDVGYGSIFRSIDYGATWIELTGKLDYGTDAFSLAYLGSGIVILGTGGGKIWRSTDSGITWTDLGQQYTETKIWSLCSLGGGIILAGTSPNSAILRSTDYGLTWTDLGKQYDESYIFCFVNVGNGVVIAGNNSGRILRSIDNGSTWSDIGKLFGQVQICSFSYVGNNIVIAGVYPTDTILRSIDGGITWDCLGKIGNDNQINALCSLGNGIVLAGTEISAIEGKILRSIDYGNNWEQVWQTVTGYLWSFCFLGEGIVLASTEEYPNSKILRSIDYGVTWNEVKLFGGRITSLCYLCNGIVLAGTVYQILRSTDYGLTWTQITSAVTGFTWNMAYLGDGIVIMATNSGHIYRSTDYGLTWTDLGLYQEGIDSTTAYYLGNGIVLAGFAGNIFRSTDYGLTWTDLGQQYGLTYISTFYSLSNGIVVAGASGHILRSTDYGLTWEDLGKLSILETYTLAICSLGDSIVLAGMGGANAKIFKSTLVKDAPPAKEHIQGTDVELDNGGSNPITAEELVEDKFQSGYNEGLLSEPTIIDNEDGTIQVSSINVLIRATSDFSGGELLRKTVPQDLALSLVDDSLNYIYIDWNNGTPIYKATTSRSIINNSSTLLVARIMERDNAIEYKVNYNASALSLSTKNFDKHLLVRGIEGIEKESGFGIQELPTRVINIGSGFMWFGLKRVSLGAITQGETGTISDLWYHSEGNWTKDTITEYNNTRYDDGSSLVGLTPNRYAVNWIFRNIETNEIDIVLGRGDYTLAQAVASTVPPLPDDVAYFYLLVGRIIVRNGADTATAIESIEVEKLSATIVSEHNDLGSLNEGDYLHLTATEKANANNQSGVNTGDQDLSGLEEKVNKGQPNGYASLDGGGKLIVTQLPNAIMAYQGTWNAETNTPALEDGMTGATAGDVYRVSVAGIQDLGSGNISFEIGDYCIYNGSTWEKADTTDAVTQINGKIGEVELLASDIPTDETGETVQEALDSKEPANVNIQNHIASTSDPHKEKRFLIFKVLADDETLTTGDGKFRVVIPSTLNGMDLIEAHAHIYTVSSSGLPLIAIFNETKTQDMLSVNITIDVNESDSMNAETQPTINVNTDDVDNGNVIRIDVDAAGTGTKGLEVRLTFQKP